MIALIVGYGLVALAAWRMLAGHVAYRLADADGAKSYRKTLEAADGQAAEELAHHILYPALHKRPAWAAPDRTELPPRAPFAWEWAFGMVVGAIGAAAWPLVLVMHAPWPWKIGAEAAAESRARARRIEELERELGLESQ